MKDPFELMGTGKNCLIMGGAGSGKTTSIKSYMDFFSDSTLLSAPTGISALNVGGKTNHKTFGLNLDVFVDRITQLQYKQTKKTKELLQSPSFATWIGDEVGMLRADVLSQIDRVMRTFRDGDKPFGGVQVCFFCDPLQLSPILKPEQAGEFYNHYRSPYFFDSPAFTNGDFEILKLETIYRQTDLDQIKYLNHLRLVENVNETLDFFNDICYSGSSRNPDALIIASFNNQVDSINKSKLSQIRGKTATFKATKAGKFEEEPVSSIVSVKVGCKVMTCVNSDSDKNHYVNGSIGIVKNIHQEYVTVTLEDSGQDVYVKPYTWYNVEKRYSKRHNKLVDTAIGEYTQMPLRLAYAITSHKSQGLTLGSGHVELGSKPLFANGQSYVILSRFRDLKKVSLSRPLGKLDVKQDKYLLDWYKSI